MRKTYSRKTISAPATNLFDQVDRFLFCFCSFIFFFAFYRYLWGGTKIFSTMIRLMARNPFCGSPGSRPLCVFLSQRRTPGRRPRPTSWTVCSISWQSRTRRRTWILLISCSTTFRTRQRRNVKSGRRTRISQMFLCPRKMTAQKMCFSHRSLKPIWKPSPDPPGCLNPKLKAIEPNLWDQQGPRVRLRWRFLFTTRH